MDDAPAARSSTWLRWPGIPSTKSASPWGTVAVNGWRCRHTPLMDSVCHLLAGADGKVTWGHGDLRSGIVVASGAETVA